MSESMNAFCWGTPFAPFTLHVVLIYQKRKTILSGNGNIKKKNQILKRKKRRRNFFQKVHNFVLERRKIYFGKDR